MNYKKIEKEFEDRFVANVLDCIPEENWAEMKREVNYFLKAKINSVIDEMIGEEWDGKEWIEMMKEAKKAGFSNLKSPEDFMKGKRQKVSELKEYKKKFNK